MTVDYKQILTGDAMAPTLNARALEDPDATETLIVRSLPRWGPSSVHVRDVVAFMRPAVEPSPYHVMVRRVAAFQGAEILPDRLEYGTPTVVPPAHVWVLADNEKMSPPTVIDSRTFGPVPLENLMGRVIYYIQSETDHGAVKNSREAMRQDAAIIDAEVDVAAVLKGLREGKSDD